MGAGVGAVGVFKLGAAGRVGFEQARHFDVFVFSQGAEFAGGVACHKFPAAAGVKGKGASNGG